MSPLGFSPICVFVNHAVFPVLRGKIQFPISGCRAVYRWTGCHMFCLFLLLMMIQVLWHTRKSLNCSLQKKNRISIAAMFMKLQFTLYQFSDSICLWYFEQFVSFNSLNISSESNSLTVSKGFQKQLAIPKLTDPNATYSSFFLLRLWTWTNFFPVSSGYFIWRSLRQPNQNRNLNRQLLTIKSRWWAVVNLKSGK